MGKDLAERFPVARATFEEADRLLGFPLSRIAFEGSDEELMATQNAQPAILVHSVAVWRLIGDRLAGRIAMAAGHSLGEFSAYVAAGALSFPDALRVVRRRGELMAEAGARRPGTMAAVLGLEEDAVSAACAEAGTTAGIVIAANFNAPGQVVISGEVAAVNLAAEIARVRGAKRVIPLNVSGAFHSPLMDYAEAGLQAALDESAFGPQAFPVVSNVTAEPVRDSVTARRLLVRQLMAPVRWTDGVRRMLQDGVTEFLEIGPGNVLAGLVKRIDKKARVRTLGTGAEVQEFLDDTSGP